MTASSIDEPTRIVLADAHVLVRNGLRHLLEAEPGLEIVAEAGTGVEALARVESLRPDIVTVDIAMPDLDGLDLIRRIREAAPETGVVVVSGQCAPSDLRRALRLGAHGYVTKLDPPGVLHLALKSVARGLSFLSPRVTPIVIRGLVSEPLAEDHGDAAKAPFDRDPPQTG